MMPPRTIISALCLIFLSYFFRKDQNLVPLLRTNQEFRVINKVFVLSLRSYFLLVNCFVRQLFLETCSCKQRSNCSLHFCVRCEMKRGYQDGTIDCSMCKRKMDQYKYLFNCCHGTSNFSTSVPT